MTRDWPARDVEDIITLIDDPRHRINEDGTIRLSLEQARAILELRLARLTALGRDEIGEELAKLAGEIGDYLDILRSRARILDIIKTELAEVKAEFATPRRTVIMLVSAFAGLETMKQAYAHAVANEYRFYSYGDACLLFRADG